MDSNEPTAWQDINPTDLARQQGPQPAFSERLQPASPEQFRDELTACLVLTAPAGMTEESRGEWLAVAWQTLKHLPADLLATGCAEARKACDHPSKIVPAIVKATEESLEWRRRMDRQQNPAHLRLSRPDYVTPGEAAAILKEYGLKTDEAA